MRIGVIFSLVTLIGAFAAPLPLAAEDNKVFAVSIEQAAAYIETDFSKTEKSLSANAIGSARENLSLTKYTIYKYREQIPSDTKKNYDNRVFALKNRIGKKVDSLINENLGIVKRSGRSAGYKFRQYLAVEGGLFETDLLPVDNALADYDEKNNGKPAPEASTRTKFFPEATSGPSVNSPAPSAAEGPVRNGNEREQATALSTASKIQGFLADENIEEASIVFRIHEQFLQKFLEAPSFFALKDSVDAAASRRQKAQSDAVEQTRNIERLLDRDKVTEAVAALQNDRESLHKTLEADDIRLLEKKVGQAYSGFLRKQADANRTMREIRDLLSAKNIENAYGVFQMSRTDLESYLYPDAFKTLRDDVMKAYAQVQNKKNLSIRIQRTIQSLCKAGKVSDAADLFAGNQNLLQQHLHPKEYATLSADVNRAKRDLRARQVQAESAAASIEALLSARRIEAAYASFNKQKESLQKNLPDKTRFVDLKERVMNAWDDLRAAQSKAYQTSKKIDDLCDRHEGRKAFALFKQESGHLRKYSAPGIFARLESTVTIANASYDANQNAARNACARIDVLLSQRQIVRAYAEYRKFENDILFYLAGDPAAENLQKREALAWESWQEMNRWAAATVRQIRTAIKNRRGNAAWSQLQESRLELRKYIDQQTLSRLEDETASANNAYSREKTRIERNAAMILSLLDQKRVEDACTAFDTLENDLRFYCAPPAFDDLKTKVASSNSLLQGKKNEARKIIATINSQIAGKRGDSAEVILSGNRSLLMKYCAAPTYKKTAEQVMLAKREYDKNVRETKQLASRLKAMAQRTIDVEAAYDQFRFERDDLARYLDKTAFSELEKTLQVQYDAFMEQRRQSRIIAGALRRMLRDGQFTIAMFQFDQNDKQLSRFLPADEYMDIMTKVTTAFHNSVHGRVLAKNSARRIRSLLNDGQISKAWAAFTESRETLEQYLPEAEFTGLRVEVTSAREEQEKKTGQAKDFAKMLKLRIARNQTWEAFRDFKLNRAELSEYLDAQTYADLETAVVNAYEQARGRAKK